MSTTAATMTTAGSRLAADLGRGITVRLIPLTEGFALAVFDGLKLVDAMTGHDHRVDSSIWKAMRSSAKHEVRRKMGLTRKAFQPRF